MSLNGDDGRRLPSGSLVSLGAKVTRSKQIALGVLEMPMKLATQMRFVLGLVVAISVTSWSSVAWGPQSLDFSLPSSRPDITPRLGHPLLGFASPRSQIDRRSTLRSWHRAVGPGANRLCWRQPNWCEIRKRRLRSLAKPCWPKRPARPSTACCFSSVHQHDAPLADLEAERLLQQQQATWQTG